MREVLEESVWQSRFAMFLVMVFASIATALAAVGVFGVVSNSVVQRTREIAVRMALGADRPDILKLVVGQGMLVTLIGIAFGVVGGLMLTRFLVSLLYEVRPTDLMTFVSVAILLFILAIAASYIPARRATRVDPMVALRYE